MTTRKAGGMHQPYKGMLLAAPQGAPKRSADRKPFTSSPTKWGCSYYLSVYYLPAVFWGEHYVIFAAPPCM